MALGRAVSGANPARRVAGYMASPATIAGAYAWKDMTVNGQPVAETNPDYGADKRHGANLATVGGKLYTPDGELDWAGFDTTVWTLRNTEKNKLPKLIGTSDDPTFNLAEQPTDTTAYTVTFDKQSGAGGSNSANAKLGEAMPAITPPTWAGHTFSGYFDKATSDGVMYYNANGTSAKLWDKVANATLYAQWDVIPVPPVPPASGGSFMGSGNAYAGNTYAGAWETLPNGGLRLTVKEADCAKFTSVTVDGVQLTAGTDYELVCGSTILNFTPAYLASLANGTHSVRVQFTDGRYDGTFTTPLSTAVTAVADVPATGDVSLAWIALTVALTLGFAARMRPPVRLTGPIRKSRCVLLQKNV